MNNMSKNLTGIVKEVVWAMMARPAEYELYVHDALDPMFIDGEINEKKYPCYATIKRRFDIGTYDIDCYVMGNVEQEPIQILLAHGVSFDDEPSVEVGLCDTFSAFLAETYGLNSQEIADVSDDILAYMKFEGLGNFDITQCENIQIFINP